MPPSDPDSSDARSIMAHLTQATELKRGAHIATLVGFNQIHALDRRATPHTGADRQQKRRRLDGRAAPYTGADRQEKIRRSEEPPTGIPHQGHIGAATGAFLCVCSGRAHACPLHQPHSHGLTLG